MFHRATTAFTALGLMFLVAAPGIAMSPYNQNFETLVQSDPDALGNDGWLIFGNVFAPNGDYLYGYGPFAAPNHELAFSAIASGEGGDDQGTQQLNVFSDYENFDHDAGNLIESNVFQEQIIDAGDTDLFWNFEFQAKLGNIEGASTAMAFIKTLDPLDGFALTNFVTVDMTNIATTWAGFRIELYVDPSLEGQIFQFGFLNTATNYEGSGIFYDNLNFFLSEVTSTPDVANFVGATMQDNFPNPFKADTRIEFRIDEPGYADLTVFDLNGRKVATLRQEEFAVGEYAATWNGKSDNGEEVATGQYWYVLNTAAGQVTRSLTFLK